MKSSGTLVASPDDAAHRLENHQVWGISGSCAPKPDVPEP
jgi:hypothetical protein